MLEETIVLTLGMVMAMEMATETVMEMVATATVETVAVATVEAVMVAVEMVVDLYKSAYSDKNDYKIAC